MRGLGAAVGIVVASMALAGQAWAATIDYQEASEYWEGDRVIYTADPPESNQVTVNCCNQLLQMLVLTDPGAAIAVGPSAESQEHCLAAGRLAVCREAVGARVFIGYLDAHLGPNADTLRVQGTIGRGVVVFGEGGGDMIIGGDGADHLDGGPGADGLHAGDNWDTIEARDGTRDNIGCGPGTDTVFADAVDSVAPGCENVQIG